MRVGRRHSACQLVGQRKVDRVVVRKVIEGLGFIEPAHFHRPLDALAKAREAQRAVTLPRNGSHAKIKPWRKNAVDFKFRLAGCLSSRQRGEIEKRIANGALDFEGSIAAEK